MRYFILVLILIHLQSCQYFEKKIPNKEALLEEELKKINWKEVDEYPSIKQCDTNSNKESRKECFFYELTNEVYERFKKDSIDTKFPVLDTIPLKVTVFPDANVTFEPQLTKYSSEDNFTTIDSIIRVKLIEFPPVEPAIKRGVKVKSQFIVPIVLKK